MLLEHFIDGSCVFNFEIVDSDPRKIMHKQCTTILLIEPVKWKKGEDLRNKNYYSSARTNSLLIRLMGLIENLALILLSTCMYVVQYHY